MKPRLLFLVAVFTSAAVSFFTPTSGQSNTNQSPPSARPPKGIEVQLQEKSDDWFDHQEDFDKAWKEMIADMEKEEKRLRAKYNGEPDEGGDQIPPEVYAMLETYERLNKSEMLIRQLRDQQNEQYEQEHAHRDPLEPIPPEETFPLPPGIQEQVDELAKSDPGASEDLIPTTLPKDDAPLDVSTFRLPYYAVTDEEFQAMLNILKNIHYTGKGQFKTIKETSSSPPFTFDDSNIKFLLESIEKQTGEAERLEKSGRALRNEVQEAIEEAIRQHPALETRSDIKIISVTGTGETIGHIATVKVKNTGKDTLVIKAQTIYIPSDGKYQSYVGKIPETKIPPGETVDIPIDGICTDVHKPAMTGLINQNPEKDWLAKADPEGLVSRGFPLVPRTVPPFSERSKRIAQGMLNPLPEKMRKERADTSASTPDMFTYPHLADTSSVANPTRPYPNTAGQDYQFTGRPYGTRYQPVWPGTNETIDGIMDLEAHPEIFAPVIIEAVDRIGNAYDKLYREGKIHTPFAGDPNKQAKSTKQNMVWYYVGEVTGEQFPLEQFQNTVFKQFQEKTGMAVSALPETDKEKLVSGVDEFWGVFMATGVEAKVLEKQEVHFPETEPVDISNKEGGCAGAPKIRFNPEYDLDMKIASEWSNAEERRKIVAAVREALSQKIRIDDDQAFQGYDINRHPTSATSFWKAGTIGGFASAYAKTWFKKSDGGWEWVWGCEPLRTRASGSMDFTLSYVHDDDCRAIVAGSAMARVKAGSSAFDAMAGNTHLENSSDQLNFLRTTKYAGKTAVEWLILRARGKTKQSFHDHVKDDLKEKVKGEITAKMEEEAQRLADQYLKGILDQLGLKPEDLEKPDFELPSLESMIEDFFGIDIPDMEELEEFISKGIDASFNLFFVANTWATANGSLVVKVGSKSGSALAHTSIHYARKEAEETKDAITWRGNQCRETFVSDALPDALTIHTDGFANMEAEALSRYGFGNGKASAYLESMNLQVLAGICICPNSFGPDKHTYSLEVQGVMDWYTADPSKQKEMQEALAPLLNQIENELENELDNMSEDHRAKLTTSEFEKMLSAKVKNWAEKNHFVWSDCKNDN